MNDEQKKAYDQFQNVNYKSFGEWLFSLSGYEFALVSSALGFLISTRLNFDEQESVGNFFILLGHTIVTIAAQERTKLQHASKYRELTPEEQVYMCGQMCDQDKHTENIYAHIQHLYSEIAKLKK